MKIAILGAGHMGGWLIKELSPQHSLAAYDLQDKKSEFGGLSQWLQSPAELAAFRPEMLINAVSLQNTIAGFESAVNYIGSDCWLCDLASVKTSLPDYYRRLGRPFVSLHPMFGPTFSDLESLREENAVIITESAELGKKFFIDLFAHWGVRVFEYSFEEHDRMMAYSLTTPFVASLVFAACVDKTAVPGTTFARHRKLARGVLSEDEHLLAEILFNPHSLTQIENITAKLEFLKHVIRERDWEEAKKVFAKLRQNV